MNATLQQPEVRAYLRQLQHLLAHSPDRAAVLDDVALHIQTATAHDPDNTDLVRQVLDELGDPATIAADTTPATSRTTARPLLTQAGAVSAVLLLAVGGIAVPAYGWGITDPTLPALLWLLGFALLWINQTWTVTDKAVGTFTIPALFAAAALIEKLALRTDPTAAAAFAGYALLTIAVSIYLIARFRTRD